MIYTRFTQGIDIVAIRGAQSNAKDIAVKYKVKKYLLANGVYYQSIIKTKKPIKLWVPIHLGRKSTYKKEAKNFSLEKIKKEYKPIDTNQKSAPRGLLRYPPPIEFLFSNHLKMSK
jgi:hypothetical protein